MVEKHPNDFEILENDEPSNGFSPNDFFNGNENRTLLGQGSRSDVKFEWLITPWSDCSQSCGTETGLKVNYCRHSTDLLDINDLNSFIKNK